MCDMAGNKSEIEELESKFLDGLFTPFQDTETCVDGNIGAASSDCVSDGRNTDTATDHCIVGTSIASDKIQGEEDEHSEMEDDNDVNNMATPKRRRKSNRGRENARSGDGGRACGGSGGTGRGWRRNGARRGFKRVRGGDCGRSYHQNNPKKTNEPTSEFTK